MNIYIRLNLHYMTDCVAGATIEIRHSMDNTKATRETRALNFTRRDVFNLYLKDYRNTMIQTYHISQLFDSCIVLDGVP